MPIHPILMLDFLQTVLYILIILVALVSLVALLLIVRLVLDVLGLVKAVRGEIKPITDQAQQTMRTVQGTTEFVSTGLVKPAIQLASIAAGVGRTVSVLRSGVIRPRPDSFDKGE